ncbi:MAG: DUF1552 domain-containing protein [Sandaracinaceae bacterium]
MTNRDRRWLGMDRRQFMRAMGLATGSLFLPSLIGRPSAHAQAPRRLMIFFTEHGPVSGRWEMRRPGLPATGSDWEMPLDDPDPMSFSPSLRPLHEHRADLNIIQGLSMTSAYIEHGFSSNNHGAAINNRLAAQGGVSGPSFDQVIAAAQAPSAGFPYLFHSAGSCSCWSGSPVFDMAGAQVNPARIGGGYSFLPNEFDRIFGALPSDPAAPPTPLERSRQRRQSTLSLVQGEYEQVLGRLSLEDQQKLQRHRDMIADLERRAGAMGTIMCNRPDRPPSDQSRAEVIRIAMTQLYPLAMACDLTRVGMLFASELSASEIGAPSTIDVHQDAAHPSTNDPAATWMESYYAVHAQQFAELVAAFKSVPEGSGTMLDNSLLIWMPELGNGWHDLHQMMFVMAGGAGGAIPTGRYLRYDESLPSPPGGRGLTIGPPHTKLLVSIMQAFGVSQSSLGITSAMAEDGSTIDLTGTLPGFLA